MHIFLQLQAISACVPINQSLWYVLNNTKKSTCYFELHNSDGV